MVITRNTAPTALHNIAACEVSPTIKEVLSLYTRNIKATFRLGCLNPAEH